MGNVVIAREFAARCRALCRRGLTRELADDLMMVGDEAMLAELEAASDAQVRELSHLDRLRRRL